MLHLQKVIGCGRKRIGTTDDNRRYVTFTAELFQESFCACCHQKVESGWLGLDVEETYCDQCVILYPS